MPTQSDLNLARKRASFRYHVFGKGPADGERSLCYAESQVPSTGRWRHAITESDGPTADDCLTRYFDTIEEARGCWKRLATKWKAEGFALRRTQTGWNGKQIKVVA